MQKARALGELLIVGVNTDASVKKLKGISRPINKEQDRAIVVDALRSVDYVSLFEEDTPYELISAIQPDVIAKGGDYTPDTIIGADVVRALGGEVVVIPLVEGKSTTDILRRIQSL